MAQTKLPDPLERRHLVERELDASQARELAEAYLAEGRSVEAVDFLSKGGARDELESLAGEAVAAGDAFLLRAIANVSGEAPSEERWRELARAAEAAGKQRYAALARQQAERGRKD